MQIEQLLRTQAGYLAPEWERQAANLRDFWAEYRRSLEDPEGFWGEEARRFSWFQPFERVLEWKFPDHRWFLGGRTNITYNALDRHAKGPGRNRVALLYLGEDGREQKLTYGELLDRVARFATALRALGVREGDRVIVYMPLTPEGIIAMLACARIGAVHSVVYAGLGVAALRERIQDAGARLVVAGDVSYRRGKPVDLESIVLQATQGLDVHVVWFNRSKAVPEGPHHSDFNALLWRHKPEAEAVPLDSEHPLFILYTSGSTGKPKGVVHVHGGYMVGVAYHLRTFFDVKEDEVFWATSDIGWIVGHSYIVYAPLLLGVTSVLREGAPDYPDPSALWGAVERYRVNVIFTAPTAVRMFMKYGPEWPARHDLSSLRLLAVAGEPLNPEAWRWAYTHLMDEGRRGFVVDNWWQTELGGPTLGTPVTLEARPGFAGVPLPGVEAKVVDAEGKEVPPGKGGLLVLRRPFPHMMRTIWGDHGRYVRYWEEVPGGVYAAGDVASRSEDGYFTVLGRADDVLNVAGHRIGTAEVESALVSHPAVAEAAVIGVPDPIKGERIQAFAVLRAGWAKTPALQQEVVQHVRQQLGPIATPGELVFVDKLPKTRSGKILRRLLRAQALGQDPGDLSTLEE
ncbi:Acetyl-coenzyme A synthetase [Meiothermus luteus]|jgi:acetyl-CoA synthetase|uniref:Acetate--CoA ligase n=1 Tax=Meiothermus luteus TaxID=2026184 RepID=A0A399EU51_9DEIN|nr:acetate--CoA ligase [Meiothermus luteus]RIH87123.1 Acetyl-coenzyme A synthetase [Meiothermus luteus]RMH57726.1 MAG: acetate--CoA ligase [Deinococcota bacterium]